MRYSYEFKLLCVDLYKSGIYPDTPNGTTDICFRWRGSNRIYHSLRNGNLLQFICWKFHFQKVTISFYD